MKTTAIITALWLLGWTALCFALSSCAYTVNADGTRAFTLDGAQAVRAIEILSEK